MYYVRKHCNHSAKALICLFISIFAVLSSFQPVSASAILPSVVSLITAAGPYSLILLPLPITIPALLFISIPEAIIAKKLLKLQTKTVKIVWNLFVINFLTSAIGLVTMPTGREMIPGLPLAFLFTAIIEGVLLVFLYPKGSRRLSIPLFKTSAAMNAASYSLLGIVLVIMIYLPSATAPENLDRTKLQGTLVAYHQSKTITVLKFDTNTTPTQSEYKTESAKQRSAVKTIDSKPCVMQLSDLKNLKYIPVRKSTDNLDFSKDGRYYAKTVEYNRGNYYFRKLIVGKNGTPQQVEFEDVGAYAFAPDSNRIAINIGKSIVICDPETADKKTLHPHCINPDRAIIAWSPDEQYIAYAAILSPFTQLTYHTMPDSIRIISLDGHELTVLHIAELYRTYDIRWYPQE